MNSNTLMNIKDMIPWRIRYGIKMMEAAGVKIPNRIKWHNDYKTYNEAFYSFIKEADIDDMTGIEICELGAGEHLIHALLEYQMGAKREYMIEIDDFARVDSRVTITKEYKLSESYSRKRKLPRPQNNESWKDYLQRIDAYYLTDGLNSYGSIPAETIDFCFSDAVFEHIRKPIFEETIKEVYRFMKRNSILVHKIDFMDHFGGGKNNLRFPDHKWENELHYRMDNYTNRLSCEEIISILEKYGFKIESVKRMYYEDYPLKRSELAPQFRNMSDEDLMTKGATIIFTK